jgi:hypothetical protein
VLITLLFYLFLDYGCRFSSGIEFSSFVTSYQILKKTWNVISSSYEDIVSNFGVGLCWNVYKEQSSDLTIIAFDVISDSFNLQSDLVSSSDLKVKNFLQFEFLCSKSNPSFSLNKTAVSLFCENLHKLDQLKSKVLTILFIVIIFVKNFIFCDQNSMRFGYPDASLET